MTNLINFQDGKFDSYSLTLEENLVKIDCYLLGGAGAIESIFCVLAMHNRIAPPTINIENLDQAVKVDVVRDKPRKLPEGPIACLNDSFGFGGHNVVLVFRSY